MYKRPTITNNDAFDAGGLQWTIVTPVRGAAHRLHRQGGAARRARADGRPEGSLHQQPVRRVRGAPHLHRAGPAEHVRRRARHPARGTRRGVRQGPLRAARRRAPAPSASATASGRSTATACATTRGARASGRRRGTTAGSPPTSTTTSASWPAASRRRTARHPWRLRVGGRPDALLRSRRAQHRDPRRRAVPRPHQRPAALVAQRHGVDASPAR